MNIWQLLVIAFKKFLGEIKHIIKYGYGSSYGYTEQASEVDKMVWAQDFNIISLVLVSVLVISMSFLLILYLYKKFEPKV